MVLLIANEVARTFGGDNNGTVCSPYKSYGRRKRCAFKNKASREGDGNITGLVAQPMLSCLPFLLLSRFCHCKYVPPQLRSHQSDRLNSGRHFGATRGNRAVNWFCGLDGRTHGWMEAAWNIRETAPYLESRETHVGGGSPTRVLEASTIPPSCIGQTDPPLPHDGLCNWIRHGCWTVTLSLNGEKKQNILDLLENTEKRITGN